MLLNSILPTHPCLCYQGNSTKMNFVSSATLFVFILAHYVDGKVTDILKGRRFRVSAVAVSRNHFDWQFFINCFTQSKTGSRPSCHRKKGRWQLYVSRICKRLLRRFFGQTVNSSNVKILIIF